MTERRSPEFQPWGLDAIREGRKTMTRRVCKWPFEWRTTPSGNRYMCSLDGKDHRAPHGEVGTIWALKEPLYKDEVYGSWATWAGGEHVRDRRCPLHSSAAWSWKRNTLTPRFMPLWAARDFVTVTGVRAERLQAISYQDCLAEGIDGPEAINPSNKPPLIYVERALREFASLWDSLHAKPKPVYRQKAIGVGKGSVATACVIDHYISHPWQDIRETREHRGKDWRVVGNPFCWCYSFGDYQRDPGRAMPGKGCSK